MKTRSKALGNLLSILTLLFGVSAFLLTLSCWAEHVTHQPSQTACASGVANCPPSENKSPTGQAFVRGSTAPYRFVAFGDWGAGTSFQKNVAAQLVKQYQRTPFDAVLMLGDNIYERGDVKQYGKAYFTDTYQPLLAKHVQFIVALGNHDRLGGYQDDQVRFFKMPGYYYRVQKPNLDIFVLDTNLFGTDQVQQKWLDKQLAASKAPWKIVMGHHPIYSSGEHGLNPSLQKTLEPILIRHKVDLYLAGHDHDYERFQPIQGVHHLVSGGGGAYLRGFETVLPHSEKRVKAHHFLSFSLDATTLTLQAIDSSGNVIDQALWTKARPAKKPAPQKLKPAS